MKLSKLQAILLSLGRPYAYMVHRSAPELPFITYSFLESDNFTADNQVYLEDFGIQIQIISDKKEFALERSLKDALNTNKIVWTQYPDNYDETTQTFTSTLII